MDTAILRSKILDLAIRGQLVPQDNAEGSALELLDAISEERGQKITPITDGIPFDLPKSWCWVKLDNIAKSSLGKTLNSITDVGDLTPYLCSINVYSSGIDLSVVKQARFTQEEKVKYLLRKGDLMICEGGDAGRCCIWDKDDEMYYQNALHRVRFYGNISPVFFKYIFDSYKNHGEIGCNGVTIQHFTQTKMKQLLFPLPPLAEQQRIVAKVDELLAAVDSIEKAQSDISDAASIIQSRILDLAIHGALVPQDIADGSALDLLASINEERGTNVVPVTTNVPFEIPSNWCWVRLDTICDVARGGSPRPIKQFLTDAEDGVNWIKIGDTEKGGKYINHSKEKIIKEGIKRSRFVHKGDFLLTNSMSFGRPYILNIDGCIHDGWLVISPYQGVFDKEYLYHLLSSKFAYDVFCQEASGGVVSNLNIDKVAHAIFPLPPLAEQRRIVAKVEELLSAIDNLK